MAAAPTASARRLQVLQYITEALQKLAATRDLAVVLLTPCVTRMHAESGATIMPAMNAQVWDQAISTRLVLFRDWIWRDSQPLSCRFVGIEKLNGKIIQGTIESVVAFNIGSVSSVPVHCGSQWFVSEELC